MATDIVVLDANQQGHDLVIGDLHGNNDNFKQVLTTLKKDDRLFIVGDLTDRGCDSFELIEKIIEKQKSNPGQLNVIRGNHEDICLNCIAGLESLANELKRQNVASDSISKDIEKFMKNNEANFKKHQGFSDVKLHMKNDGRWLVELFIDELSNGNIKLNPDGSVQYSEKSNVKLVKDFMSNLPYIIHVNGEKPFNTVHADMPINDRELQARIANNNLNLTKKEKDYATWARPIDPTGDKDKQKKKKEKDIIVDKGRDAHSVITYVGHNPINDKNSHVVRPETNTVNLDVSSYKKNVSLVANHSLGTCQYEGLNSSKFNEPFYKRSEKTLNEHLTKQATLKHSHSSTLNVMQAISANPREVKSSLENELHITEAAKSSNETIPAKIDAPTAKIQQVPEEKHSTISRHNRS